MFQSTPPCEGATSTNCNPITFKRGFNPRPRVRGYGLRRYRGDWYRYAETHWKLFSKEMLEECLYHHIDVLKVKKSIKRHGETDEAIIKIPATPKIVTEVSKAMPAAGHILIPDDLEAPVNLKDLDADSSTLLPCRNGILDLETKLLIPHSPHYFNLNCLEFDYSPDSQASDEWENFLESVWGDDRDSITALQMFMGYCLTNDTRQQKILLLLGQKRSGKGTIGNILSKLLGHTNVCSPTLSSLQGEFGLQALLGKKVAIIPVEMVEEFMQKQLGL